MSRTYRRRGHTHEYRWVLRDRSDATPWWAHALLDLHSKEGRHAIARFHSDAEFTMRSGGPPLVVRLHGGRGADKVSIYALGRSALFGRNALTSASSVSM